MCSFDSALTTMRSHSEYDSEKDRSRQNRSKGKEMSIPYFHATLQNLNTVINSPSIIISLYFLVSKRSKTKSGSSCHIPFIYNDLHYDTCINVDNGGVSWCYTNITKKEWDICDSLSSPNSIDKNAANLPAAFVLPATFRKINKLYENYQFPGNS